MMLILFRYATGCITPHAVLLARTLENVAPVHAVTTAVAIAIIISAGVATAFLPALRIIRVQPAGLLRS